MRSYDMSKFTKEQMLAARQCRTPEELIDLAKQIDIDLTREEAEAFLAESSTMELDMEDLESIAGGREYCYTNGCALKCISNL